MQVIADFHTHSRFAMACSSKITINGMEAAALEKGISLIGTSDFLHSQWLSEMKANLEPCNESGLFRIKNSDSGVRFLLSGEVSTIFEGRDKRTKKVHHIILLPDFESLDSLRDVLKSRGALDSDGRPQLSMSASELVEDVFKINKNAFVFPAHAWTPYFGVFGSLSGFDSMKDAYEDQEKHVFALETGLSSDPPLNWMISKLDKYALLSNSDMHSLPKLGREANVFEIEEKDFTYGKILDTIKEKNPKSFRRTIEFYPEEGKYHFDGHKDCKFSVDPTKSTMSVCRVCGKKLLVGVVHRIKDLANRPYGFVPKNAVPYVNTVPLIEIIAYVMKGTTFSPRVESQYRKLLGVGKEFDLLMNTDLEVIEENSTKDIAKAISNVRENKIKIIPGYAGIFGEIELLNRKDSGTDKIRQRSLFGD
jgi:uncharacterized protein (TIGR00375 family)